MDIRSVDPYDSSMRLQRPGTVEAERPGVPGDPGSEPTPRGRPRRRYDPAWNDWTPPRRWPGILLTCLIVLGFLSVVIWHLQPHSVAHAPKTFTGSQIQHPKPPFIPLVKGTRAIAFSGTHDRGGMHFVSSGGLLILHARCTCQYNFVVTISNTSAIPISFPVNSTGYNDSVLNATVPAGPIVVSVVALGPWSIQLIQPLATTPAILTPFKYFSSGNDVVGPFSAANKYVCFRFLSVTNGSVMVHVLSVRGFGAGTPFSGNIALSESKVLKSLPNPYFLEVDAAGYWNLEARRAPCSL